MKNTTVFLLAMLCPFLWLGAQTETHLKLDVCHNFFTYVVAGPTDANGYGLRGSNFHLQGYIYPEGTFDTHGVGSGILANGDAEFPDEVIGTWYCSGWYIQDEATTTTGAWVVSSQLFKVEHPTLGYFELTSDGTELFDFNIPFARPMMGGTDAMKEFKGEMIQENLAGNASGFANVGFTFNLENVVKTRLGENTLSFICPDEITVEAQPNAGGMYVEWEAPTVFSDCMTQGAGCAAAVLNGFTYLCEWNGNHYYLSDEAMPWEDAQGASQALGGRLAVIESASENEFLAKNISMSEGVFIGLSDAQQEGNFQWSNGTSANYDNWDMGEPNNLGGGENYVAMHGWNAGKWADYSFWVSKRFLVEFNCGLSPNQISGPASGDFLTVGTHIAKYDVMDECGNFAQCEVKITVEERMENCGDDVVNLALNQNSSQSGTQQDGNSALANDGNTDGNFWVTNSVAITDWQKNPWWEVDLGGIYQLSELRIFNRTDCCTDFQKNYYVLISETPFTSTDLAATKNQAGVYAVFNEDIASTPSVIAAGGKGRYIRIQLSDEGFLSLAEVEVMGCESSNTLITPPINENSFTQKNIPISFSLFPNPTSEVLNLQFEKFSEQPVFIQVFDLQGRLVQQRILENLQEKTIQLQMEKEPAGIYFVRVRMDDEDLKTQRFVLEKTH